MLISRKYMMCVSLLCFVNSLTLLSQTNDVEDSLLLLLNKETDSYQRVLIYEELIGETYLSNPDNAFGYSLDLIAFSDQSKSIIGLARGYAWRGFMEEQKGRVELGLECYMKAARYLIQTDSLYELGSVYNNIATTYAYLGYQDSSMFYYWKSLELNMQFTNMEIVSATLSNIGKLYFKQGKIREPLELYSKALFIAQTYHFDRMAASTFYNIAEVYEEHAHYPEALQYYFNALSIESSLDDKYGMAYSLRAIGNVLERMNRNQEALNYYHRSELLLTEIGNLQGLGLIMIDKGIIQFKVNKYLQCIESYKQGLVLLEQVQDKQGIVTANTKLGECYLAIQQDNYAMQHLNAAYTMALELGYPLQIRDAARFYYLVLEKKGDKGKAFDVYKMYTQMKDSVENVDAKKLVMQQQLKFQFEKEQLLKEQEESKRLEAESLRKKRRNTLQYSLIFLAILLSFSIIFSSGALKISYRVAQFLIFGSLLILFEFLLILSDPVLDNLTGGIPIYKLLANSLLAFSIFPLHAWLEKRLIRRLKSQ